MFIMVMFMEIAPNQVTINIVSYATLDLEPEPPESTDTESTVMFGRLQKYPKLLASLNMSALVYSGKKGIM